MKQINIKDPKRNGYFFMMQIEDFEYVNPVQKMSETVIGSMTQMITNKLIFAKENNKLPNIPVRDPDSIIRKVALKQGMAIWKEEYKKIISKTVPEKMFSILESNSKKEQIKSLKGLSLTTDELILFTFKAWENYDFTYSMYTSEHQSKGLDETEMPGFAYKEEDGNITTIGKTNLNKGQIKHAIDFRRVTISKFLDRGNTWHCFFMTYKSLKGEERGWEGKPHLHYISNNWGLSRDEVLSQLRSKNYKLPSPLPHIDYHTHRNPRSKQN